MFLEAILSAGNIAAIIVMLIVIIGLFFGAYFLSKAFAKKETLSDVLVEGYTNQKAKTIINVVETSILVALSVVFDLIFKAIPFFDMPQGGSVSLTMLPILILAFRRGAGWGILGGVIYGIINLLLDGVLYHWASFFLDYTIAFGIVGLAGVFKPLLKKSQGQKILWIIVGSLVGILGRLLCSTLAGVICFETDFVASVIYNAPYTLISGLLDIIILVVCNRLVDYGMND